ncbi:hypothetical protein LELO110150_17820 [Legionella longbeachae]
MLELLWQILMSWRMNQYTASKMQNFFYYKNTTCTHNYLYYIDKEINYSIIHFLDH